MNVLVTKLHGCLSYMYVTWHVWVTFILNDVLRQLNLLGEPQDTLSPPPQRAEQPCCLLPLSLHTAHAQRRFSPSTAAPLDGWGCSFPPFPPLSQGCSAHAHCLLRLHCSERATSAASPGCVRSRRYEETTRGRPQPPHITTR